MLDIGAGGACNSNTLNHDVASGTYLLSLSSLDTIIEVDGATGETNRWLGHVQGSYTFDPVESTLFWRRGPCYTDAGTPLVSSDLTGSGSRPW